MDNNGCTVNKNHRVIADIKKGHYGKGHKVVLGKRSCATELLPCPFCGAQPITDIFHDEEDHFHLVQCVNDDCPAAPITTGATAAEAAGKWNVRNGGAA
jgi:hypothetical protein